jgi:hypothetical protein
MEMKVGSRLRSRNSTCEVIVVKAPSTHEMVLCAAAPMSTDPAAAEPSGVAGGGEMIQLGKRYTDDVSGIELLCTKAGAGPLLFGGRELGIKAAKALPASD